MRLFSAVLLALLTTTVLHAQPKVSISQTTVDCGTVVLLDSRQASFTIKNTGDTAFNFLGYSTRSGPWTSEFKVVSGFRPVFEPDSSVLVVVSFTPKTITANHQHLDSLHLIFPSLGDSVTVLLKGMDHDPMHDTLVMADTFISMPGGSVTVPQYLTFPLTAALDSVYSFGETVTYDPRILAIKSWKPGTVISGWSISHIVMSPGQEQFRGNALGHGVLGSGEFMRFEFDVLDNAPVVSTSSLVQDAITFGAGFEPIMHSQPGRVIVIDSCVARTSSKALGSTILQNAPNPFHDETLLTYQLATNSHVSIRLFDARGNLVRTVLDAGQVAGLHELRVNRDELSVGVYTCLFEAGSIREIRKLVVAP